MILSAQSIRYRCRIADDLLPPLISPFHERSVSHGMSFGLSSCGYDVRIAEHMSLPPGGFALGSTMERFHMRDNLMAVVHDKSSWGRKGLAVQNTVLEPGWKGYLTIELSNHGNDQLYFSEGMPIAQIVFHMLDEPTESPYRGKYQNQASGPQHARYEFEP